ncbi:toprim domain-containing protein [Limnohabitans sp.]
MTHYETEQTFLMFIRECAIDTNDPIIGDGALHRFHIIGDKKGSKNGAYVLHVDGIANGFVENHRTGQRHNWKANKPVAPLSPAEKAEFEAKKRNREREKQREYEQIAIVARKTWQQSVKITNSNQHNYLLKKRITGKYARILAGDLLIALWNEQREISTLQFIDQHGEKRFLKGGKKAGCFAPVGKHHAPTAKILICEGYATAESLHDDTGHFVIAAMDANNLESVARIIRRLFPDAPIVICGDNDVSGVGQNAAKRAAAVCGGSWIVPTIAGADFNDVISGGVND